MTNPNLEEIGENMGLTFSLISKIKEQLKLQPKPANPAGMITDRAEQDQGKPDQAPEAVPESEGRPVSSRELELLYTACSDLLTSGDGEAFRKIAGLVLEHLGVSGCSIWEINSGQAQEPIRLAFVLAPEARKVENLSSLDFEVTALVAGTGEPVVSQDIRKEGRLPKVRELNPIGVLALPLVNRKELLGTFSIWSHPRQERPGLTTVEVELVATLAQILSLGLDYYRQVSEYHQHQRLKKELQIAREIQQGLAPRALPRLEGISLETRTMAANQVGGDYVDVILTQGGKMGIVIGDVMGKGIPAALFMVMTRTVFRAVAKRALLPHQVLTEVNEVLLTDLHNQGSFVTLFYALYDPGTNVLVYANAGHNPPIAYRSAKDEFFILKAKGVYIGAKPGANYCLSSFRLQAGDIVVFYSDGLKEAMNNQREQFGVQRVMDTVRKYAIYDSPGITDCLSYALADFTGDAPQSDDITMAILKVQ